WIAAAAALGGVAFLNRDFYGFLRRERGLSFALACFPLHLLYFVCGGGGFVYAWLSLHVAGCARWARLARMTSSSWSGRGPAGAQPRARRGKAGDGRSWSGSGRPAAG